MSIFELIMLVCFGLSWPFSIYKSYTSKSIKGKSPVFLGLVLVGYVSGIINKLLNNNDIVTVVYILNAVMVTIDLILYYRNKKYIEDTGR